MTTEWGKNIYSNPEVYGLTVLDSIEWADESYQFEMTVLWHDPETDACYVADDSGCSCPAPYEEYESIGDLTKIERLQDLIDHLAEGATKYGKQGEVADMVRAYRERPVKVTSEDIQTAIQSIKDTL